MKICLYLLEYYIFLNLIPIYYETKNLFSKQ